MTLYASVVLSMTAKLLPSQSPRGMWMAEWVRGRSIEPRIGILKLRDNRLSFSETIGQADWDVNLSAVRRVVAINAGASLLIDVANGHEFIVSIMQPDLTPAMANRAGIVIERALQLQSAFATEVAS